MRNAILWAVLGVVLVVVNFAIVSKERLLARGETMLLELAPIDPRSLLQGDFIVLRYSLAREAAVGLGQDGSSDGCLVVALDENQVASFRRLDDGAQQLAADERYLAYRQRGEQVRVASDAFFFQEGHEDIYSDARYGELKVDANGDAILVGVRDAELNRLELVPEDEFNE